MKQNVGSQLTDAAAEFARVMELFAEDETASNVPAFTVVNKYVNPSDTIAVIRIYALLLKRSGDILYFANDVQDEFIDDDLRRSTCEAIATLRGMFSPNNFATGWPQVKNNCLIKQHIQSLKYFSRTMRAHRPLIKITDDRLDAAKVAVNDALNEIRSREDLPSWAQRTIAESVQDLIFVLDNFSLCGHDEVIDLILQLHAKAAATSSVLEKEGQKHYRLEKLAISLVLLVDLFTSAPNIAQAIPVYKGWIGALSEVAVPLIAPPLRQIEGPKPHSHDPSASEPV